MAPSALITPYAIRKTQCGQRHYKSNVFFTNFYMWLIIFLFVIFIHTKPFYTKITAMELAVGCFQNHTINDPAAFGQALLYNNRHPTNLVRQ